MGDMEYRIRYQQWCNYSSMDDELKAELDAIKGDEKEIYERFYQDLTFGTGGMRGILGAGTNRMNTLTIQRASCGLALYLLSTYAKEAKERGVVIAYDCRNHSTDFAREAALTLNSFGIRTYVFDRLTPTPELSFAVKYRNAVAGIVITASHNPKEYNGYKVYNEYGCQIVTEAADAIWSYINMYQELNQLPIIVPYERAVEQDLYHEIGDDYHLAYQQAVLKQACLQDEAAKENLSVVYTPLHGAGLMPVTSVLKKDGFTKVHVLESQSMADGNFSTVRSPNPEEKDALQLGIKKAMELDADLVLGTDPDSDRVGIAVKDNGRYVLLSGNQTGALLVDFITGHRVITEKSTLITTIVTSELGPEIARARGVETMYVLTGFKYIGDKMIGFEKNRDHEFIMGYEESYGYLFGQHAKDKDAVVSSMMICEMAAEQKALGKTLVDRLQELYSEFGYYVDSMDSFTLPGADGQQRIADVMTSLRGKQVMEIGGLAVKETKDYLPGTDGLPSSNVLKYFFAEGGWMAARPSGTEPKIKFYYSLRGENMEVAEAKVTELRKAVKEIMA